MPVEGTHGKIVIMALENHELLFEILKGVELVGNVKFPVIPAMAALDLAVVPRRKRADDLVPNAQFLKRCFKQGPPALYRRNSGGW